MEIKYFVINNEFEFCGDIFTLIVHVMASYMLSCARL